MTTYNVPTSVTNPISGEVIPLPGHADYDTGTSTSATVAMLANDRTATITCPAAEGGGLSVVASDITITNITPPLTTEMRYRLRPRASFGDPDAPRIARTNGAGTTISGFNGLAEIQGYLADGTKVTLREQQMQGNTPFTGTIGPTGITGITPPLNAKQAARAVNGTIGRRASGPTFSGAGSAGTGRAKIASVAADGTSVTFASGSSSSNSSPASGPFNLYAACGFPSGTGTWNVSIRSAGTDVSFPLQYWMTGTVGSDLYTDKSGTLGAPNTILFPASTDYYVEKGLDIGRRSKNTVTTDYAGRVWPQTPVHAMKYLTIKSAGTTRATRSRLIQADDTVQDDGTNLVTVNCTAAGTTITNITPPLGPNMVDRINAAPGVTTISGLKADNSNGAFTGGSPTNKANIGSISADGTTATLSAGTASETRTAASVTIKVPPQEQGKDNWQMFSVSAPGAITTGGVTTERAAMTHDVTISDLVLQMGNGTTSSAATDSRYTPREFWHAFTFGLCDTIVLERLDLRNAWGDFFFFTGSTQAALSSATDTGVMADNVIIRDSLAAGCGRHAFTLQGDTGLDVDRLTALGITRLFIDTEMTSPGPISAGASFTDCVIEYGSALWHMGPNAKFGEPPYALAGVGTVSGSKILTVPADMIDTSFMNAPVTGTGIPSSTRLRRRLSPTQIEMSKAATATGTVTVEIGLPGVISDLSMTRLDIISKGGITITGDTAPRKAKAYYTFDATAGDDLFSNVTFDTRHDALTYAVSDIVALGVGSVAALAATPFIEYSGSLTPYSSTSTSMRVQKVKADGSTVVTNAKTSSGPDRTITTGVTTAGSRTIASTVTGTFLNTDKGCDISGGGLRPGSYIESWTGGKSITAQQPASSSASGASLTIGGKKRAWSALVPVTWHGWTVSECRNVGPGDWPGGNSIYAATNGPMIMFPANMDELLVEKCFARGQLGTATTCTTTCANVVTSLPSSLVTGSNSVWGASGIAEVVTSTGVALVNYTGRSGTTLTGCTLRSGTGSISLGARIAKAANPMVGLFTAGTPTVGLGSMGTASNNRWPGAYDNQIPQTPSTTVNLTLTMDNPDATRPTATVVATRSDAAPLKGSVQILRDGVIAGSAIFDGSSSTVITEVWEDQASTGSTWLVQWAGSWDTRGTTEGLTVVDPPPATPTSIELSTDLPSPQEVGTTINITATLTPTGAVTAGQIGIEYPELDPGNVYLEPWDTFAGESFALPAAGAYSVIFTFVPDDPDAYLPSSKELRFIAQVTTGDTTPPEVVSTVPVDGATVASAKEITVTFTEDVTDVQVVVHRVGADTPKDGNITGADDVWTWTPVNPFRKGAVYTVTVRTATDLAGNALAAPFLFTFTTRPRSSPHGLGPAIPHTTPGLDPPAYAGPTPRPPAHQSSKPSSAVFPSGARPSPFTITGD